MTAASPTRVRSWRIDAMRGLAMMCVVLGHAIVRNVGADEPAFRVVLAFEMPLFAFVTGYLTHVPANARAWLVDRAGRLLLPFFAWVPVLWFFTRFAWTGLDVVGIPAELPAYLRVVVLNPRVGLWYLAVAFFWCAIAAVAARLGSWTLVVAFGALWFGLPDLTLALHGDLALKYLLQLLPFFAVGWLLRRRRLNHPAPRWQAALAGAAFAAVFVVAEAGGLLWLARYSDMLAATLVSVFGVAAAVLLVRTLSESAATRALAAVGRASLGVYAAHLLFLRTGPGVGWTATIGSFFIALGASLVVTWALRRTRPTARVFLGERGARSRTSG